VEPERPVAVVVDANSVLPNGRSTVPIVEEQVEPEVDWNSLLNGTKIDGREVPLLIPRPRRLSASELKAPTIRGRLPVDVDPNENDFAIPFPPADVTLEIGPDGTDQCDGRK
jgi:hypothetical protein